jgi:TFIIF-interacting CTD phosphatase-like protein
MNIVLDLDETLVSVASDNVKNYDFAFYLGYDTYYVRKRPDLDLFLRYIFKKFHTVSVWTAATRPYAEAVINGIMTANQRDKLAFVLAREDLVINNRGEITKPLAKLPLHKDKTIMIDDRSSVVSENVGNAIIVPQWKGTGKDKCLAQLMVVLDGILLYGETLSFGEYSRHFSLEELTGKTK